MIYTFCWSDREHRRRRQSVLNLGSHVCLPVHQRRINTERSSRYHSSEGSRQGEGRRGNRHPRPRGEAADSAPTAADTFMSPLGRPGHPMNGRTLSQGRWASPEAAQAAANRVDPSQGHQVVELAPGVGTVVHGGVSTLRSKPTARLHFRSKTERSTSFRSMKRTISAMGPQDHDDS